MIARASTGGFAARLNDYKQRVERRLEQALGADAGTPEKLRSAMKYSVLGAGKRVRPLLAYASGELCGIPAEAVDPIAASVELVHAYSLVHDDLPAMDDDDLRRGKPTTHRAFDEATAILTGDALQALAFEVLCTDPALAAHPSRQVKVIGWLARAIGPAGMVGGQALDLEAEGRRVTEPALENIHRRKTGQLIRSAIMMPSELAELAEHQRVQLDVFASEIGLLFQIRDDLLEIEQDTARLGKNAGSDTANEKSTYPSVLGVSATRGRAEQIHERAMSALATFDDAGTGLRWLSEFIANREY